MKVIVLMSCFNRIEKTRKFVESLITGNPEVEFEFVVVDDGSADGTFEWLESVAKKYHINVLRGNGQLYYSGAMRKAMEYVIVNKMNSDYVMLSNDDVEFFDNAVERLLVESKEKNDSVIVGVTCNREKEYTYGAIKYDKGIKYHGVGIEHSDMQCDTFNANCVIVPWKAFVETGVMDSHYVHALGDFDYGLALKRNGYFIYPSTEYVGICNRNESKGTWGDKSLSRTERIRKKEQVKGAPWKPWFYFLKKNFGVLTAIKGTITPYLKIVLNK